MLTLGAALQEAEASIGRVDAQAIFTHLLGVNRAYLAANHMRVLTESEDARADSMVAQRSLGHPVAYLVGKREFYSRDFAVGPDVLIPRPETETLVDAALAVIPGGARAPEPAPAIPEPGARDPITILDLGTGSGVIAITLALEIPHAQVTAVDLSQAALRVAGANAEALGAKVELLAGAWYEPVAGRRFDLIVSNPPYVAARDPHLSQGDLRFEPRAALTDGSGDGLDSVRAIVAGARARLNPGGSILVEHGHDQAHAVAELLRAAGFDDPLAFPDLAGISRVAGGKMTAT
jgi:release factor glutamine methyltransferase